MSNMSYCRFGNTARDLDECEDALERMMDGDPEDGEAAGGPEHLSDDEKRAAKRLVSTCLDVLLLLAEYGGMDFEGLADEPEPEETLLNAMTALAAEADEAHNEWREKQRQERADAAREQQRRGSQ